MRKLLIFAGALALFAAHGAYAQNVVVLPGGCGTASAGTSGASGGNLAQSGGGQNQIYVDTTGNLCTSASAGTVNANLKPTTSGGLSILRKQVANNTTSFAVDASPGQLYGIEAYNNGSTIAYIKLYNAAQGSTTCGSGTPVYQGMIPAPTAGGGGYISMNVQGLAFSTAITACVTTGFADNDTTAPAASTYVVNFLYK
jgi:hypothetical protein